MAVSANDVKVGPVIPAAGVTTISLDFDGTGWEAGWVEVFKGSAQLVLGNDFTVSGSGTINAVVNLLDTANGTDAYTVYLVTPLERSSDLQLRGEFKSAPFNTEMDRIWQRLQLHETLMDLKFGVRRSDTAPAALVPSPEKVIGFGPGGSLATAASTRAELDAAVAFLNGLEGSGDANSSANITYTNGLTGAVSRSVQAKLRDAVSVKDFGAIGDGVTDDTAAIQAAIDAADHVHFPSGTYKVTCGSTTTFDYGNTTIPVHYALDIDKSGLTLTGDRAVIDVHGYDNPAGSEINYTLSTAKNMTAGTLENIWIEGLDFEFDPTGKVASTYRSMHIVGCKGVTVKDCRFYSSGSRYGATITLQNTSAVVLDGLDYDNTTQGMNFSYVSDVQMSNISFDNFNEAIDFDRVVRRVEASNIRFIGNGSGQCWDMNSCQDMKLSNISAKDSGNVILINFKATTPLTYANYVSNDAVTAYTVSRNISINGLSMDNCAQAGSAIYVGITFNTNADDVIQDIFLSNVMAYQSGGIQVEGCRNFTLKDSVWNEAYGITASGFGLLFLAKSSYTNNELSLTLDNVKIKDVENAADAIRISVPSKAVLRDVWVENYPQDAVEISSPETHALISLRDCSFLRTVDTTVTGVACRFTSFSSDDVLVDWDNIRITQYTSPIVVSGAGGAFPKRIIPVGNLDTTGSTAQGRHALSARRKVSLLYAGRIFLWDYVGG